MARIAKRVDDKRLLKLIRAFLNAGVMENGLLSPSVEGTPQGGPLSPLLSNIVLDELDRELERRGHRHVRYADGTPVQTSNLKGCKSPDPNRPFGDLAGGRVGGAS
jgi:retron-type reverse transcriptase